MELKPINISEEMRRKVEDRIAQIEEEMENEVTEKGQRHKKMWKMLKKHYPKIAVAVPVGKKDGKGKIVTDHEGLKRLYLQTY